MWIFVINPDGSPCYPVGGSPEAKDLRKILLFSSCQGDVLLWSLRLHSCTIDLRARQTEEERELR